MSLFTSLYIYISLISHLNESPCMFTSLYISQCHCLHLCIYIPDFTFKRISLHVYIFVYISMSLFTSLYISQCHCLHLCIYISLISHLNESPCMFTSLYISQCHCLHLCIYLNVIVCIFVYIYISDFTFKR